MQTTFKIQRRPHWVLEGAKTKTEIQRRKIAFGSGVSREEFKRRLTLLKHSKKKEFYSALTIAF